jgi:hypothetical protein
MSCIHFHMKIERIFILSSLVLLSYVGLSSDVLGQNYTQKNFWVTSVGKCSKFVLAGKDVTEKGLCILYLTIPGFKEGGKTPQITILTHTEGYRERKETARIEFEVAKLTSTSNGDTEFIINSITTMGSHPNEIAGIPVSGTCKLRRIDARDSEISCDVETNSSISGNFSVSFKRDDRMLDPGLFPPGADDQRKFSQAANRFLDGTNFQQRSFDRNNYVAREKQKLPFIGTRYFNFMGGTGTVESITIDKNGKVTLKVHGTVSTEVYYTGKFSNPVGDLLLLNGNKVYRLDDKGQIIKGCRREGEVCEAELSK